MSTGDIPGPDIGLSAEQWRQLQELGRTLQPAQALWLSGYFAGLGQAARDAGLATGALSGAAALQTGTGPYAAGAEHGAATGAAGPAPAPAAASGRSVTVLYASETGNSAALAKSFAVAATAAGLAATVADMADYKTRRLRDEQDLVLISSTHGEGDPPQSALAFNEFLLGRKAPKLPGVRYAVLALGDSTYERYCEAGKRLDRRLAELGAARLVERVDCDVDYEEPAAAWADAVLRALQPAQAATAVAGTAAQAGAASSAGSAGAVGAGVAGVSMVNHGIARSGTAFGSAPTRAPLAAGVGAAAGIVASFDKRRPFSATVIENLVLTGRGSSKQTRHIELSIEGSGLSYEPGDALGVLPDNDPALVERLLTSLSLRADAPVKVKVHTTTLGEALATDFEISIATPRLIEHWARVSGASELRELLGEDKSEQRAAFLRAHHVIDILRRFAVKGVDAQTLLTGLRPLQPRLYSIASSAAAAPDEVHLTVSTVRYQLHGEPRAGVASGFFAERAAADATVPVFVQANEHFRLPADDVPILMIGAGTGVAPYRAFLQQREATGAGGRSWLVFGERNFHTDFLYQTEWQRFLKDGVLTRMNVAFSRDHAAKRYVQHRLREHAREVYAWLAEGAHVYVCGDAARLAPDVHAALGDILQQAGGRSAEDAAQYLADLQRDHRYQRDVY